MAHEPWIDSKEASKYIGSSADWLVANIQKLQIPYSRLGRQYRFKLSELDEWIRNHFMAERSEVHVSLNPDCTHTSKLMKGNDEI